jgi:hypothetical protein
MKKNNKRFIRHEQWIEIERREGKTVTLFYPPNDEFEELRLKMDPPPDMIYRRLNFIHGVPPEYLWIGPTLEFQEYGGLFLQRITVAEWPEIFLLEKLNGNKFVISARFPQPRPEVLGPCPCPHCIEERAHPENGSRYDRFV